MRRVLTSAVSLWTDTAAIRLPTGAAVQSVITYARGAVHSSEELNSKAKATMLSRMNTTVSHHGSFDAAIEPLHKAMVMRHK